MKYQFMKKYQDTHSVGRMAEVLGVSRSGFYDWLIRPESNRSRENRKLLEHILQIHRESNGVYGSPRIYKALRKRAVDCGKNRVVRLMKQFNIRSKTRKKFKPTTNSAHDNPVAANVLDRNFTVHAPNTVWVSDITYIHTNEGWLYLCVIIDLFSRKVIGWSMSNRITTKLLLDAFSMACISRNPGKQVIFHSDRGVQYTSKAFQDALEKRSFICSMSRKGNCWDNACAESFFRSLKVEEVYHKKYRTREESRRSIFKYIEIFYNRKRIHSFLDDMSPEEYEKKCA